jgi:hypothetical protein
VGIVSHRHRRKITMTPSPKSIRDFNDPIDDKDLYKRLSNTLEVDVRQKGHGRFFGESSHAIWQLDNVTLGKHPGIHHMALIPPAEQLRLGKNLIPLPPGKYVSNFINRPSRRSPRV